MAVDSGSTVQTTEETPAPPLRRNLKFQAYWIGATAGGVAMGVVSLAFPLLVLAISGSPAQAAAFGAIQAGIQIALGIPAGALADRMNRRVLLIVSELMRFGAIASVVVALKLGHPGLPQLFVVAAVLGAAQTLGGPARALVLRAIVPQEQLTQALSQDELRVSTAGLLGPMGAGWLYGLARIAPFAAALVGCLISLTTASLVRFDGRPTGGGRKSGGAFQGMVVLWRQRHLRWITVVAAGLNFAGAAVILIVVVLLQRQHYSSGAVGFALAGEAAGGIVGALITSRLHTWMQPGKLLLTVCWLCVPLLAALAIPAGPIWVFALMFAVSAGMPALLVMIDILVFRQVEDAVRGRVIAGTFMAFTIGAPLGSLASGLLLEVFSPQVSILIVCALLMVPLCLVSTKRTFDDVVWPD